VHRLEQVLGTLLQNKNNLEVFLECKPFLLYLTLKGFIVAGFASGNNSKHYFDQNLVWKLNRQNECCAISFETTTRLNYALFQITPFIYRNWWKTEMLKTHAIFAESVWNFCVFGSRLVSKTPVFEIHFIFLPASVITWIINFTSCRILIFALNIFIEVVNFK